MTTKKTQRQGEERERDDVCSFERTGGREHLYVSRFLLVLEWTRNRRGWEKDIARLIHIGDERTTARERESRTISQEHRCGLVRCNEAKLEAGSIPFDYCLSYVFVSFIFLIIETSTLSIRSRDQTSQRSPATNTTNCFLITFQIKKFSRDMSSSSVDSARRSLCRFFSVMYTSRRDDRSLSAFLV